MEGDVSRSFDLSRTLCQDSGLCLLSPRRSRGWGTGWLDHRLFRRRALEDGQ